MPTEHTWVPPELMVKTARGPIFHAYKEGEADRVLEYWYTTDETEDPKYEFDIRELTEYHRAWTEERRDHRAILKAAAENDEIKFPGGASNG